MGVRFSVRFLCIVCGQKLRCIRPLGSARTGVVRCYKHDTNINDVSMGNGFRLFKRRCTDKTCILPKTFMSGPQNLYDVQGFEVSMK